MLGLLLFLIAAVALPARAAHDSPKGKRAEYHFGPLLGGGLWPAELIRRFFHLYNIPVGADPECWSRWMTDPSPFHPATVSEAIAFRNPSTAAEQVKWLQVPLEAIARAPALNLTAHQQSLITLLFERNTKKSVDELLECSGGISAVPELRPLGLCSESSAIFAVAKREVELGLGELRMRLESHHCKGDPSAPHPAILKYYRAIERSRGRFIRAGSMAREAKSWRGRQLEDDCLYQASRYWPSVKAFSFGFGATFGALVMVALVIACLAYCGPRDHPVFDTKRTGYRDPPSDLLPSPYHQYGFPDQQTFSGPATVPIATPHYSPSFGSSSPFLSSPSAHSLFR